MANQHKRKGDLSLPHGLPLLWARPAMIADENSGRLFGCSLSLNHLVASLSSLSLFPSTLFLSLTSLSLLDMAPHDQESLAPQLLHTRLVRNQKVPIKGMAAPQPPRCRPRQWSTALGRPWEKWWQTAFFAHPHHCLWVPISSSQPPYRYGALSSWQKWLDLLARFSM